MFKSELRKNPVIALVDFPIFIFGDLSALSWPFLTGQFKYYSVFRSNFSAAGNNDFEKYNLIKYIFW